METNENRRNHYFRELDFVEPLILEAINGQACISDLKKAFKAGVDEDFKALDAVSPATEETQLSVSETLKDGTFSQIFSGLSDNLDSLALSQAQIVRFCEKYPKCLRKGFNFFLMKAGREYFVVQVLSFENGLHASVFSYLNTNVWKGEFRFLVFYPKR